MCECSQIQQTRYFIHNSLYDFCGFPNSVIFLGYILKWVGQWQNDTYQKGTTIVGLALNIGYLAGGIGGQGGALPKHLLFDDNAYFEVKH